MKKTYIFTITALIGVVAGILFQFNKISSDKDQSLTQTTKFNKMKKEDGPKNYYLAHKEMTTRIGEDKSGYGMNYRIKELNKAKSKAQYLKRAKGSETWTSRGPANVGGRTRTIIIDPDDSDHKTWYAGATTGGFWKTIDEGETWTLLSDEFTNISISAIFMAPSNYDVIYAGTGESYFGGGGYAGNGIWKSTDRGVNWTQLASTSNDPKFLYTNRLVVYPDDENIVLAATETGIYKTIDGGTSWTEVYASATGIEDLKADPVNSDTLYGGESLQGIVRSFDGGLTWEEASSGMLAGDRFEIAVSPVDHNTVFVSASTTSEDRSYVYMSKDNATTWKRFNDDEQWATYTGHTEEDYLIQGGYDNAITAHPFNANEVFVGGVCIWHCNFDGEINTEIKTVTDVFTTDLSFIEFINFSADYFNGALSTDDGTDVVDEDWISVEIRFGTGITQKAHRFTVPDNSTSGVAYTSYTYEDYIDVPFQVWDITNNKQLMVSFRDQEKDGEFNLYERLNPTTSEYGELGREYIMVNSVEYNATTPDANIAQNGGVTYKTLYFLWPSLAIDQEWTPSALPESKITILYDYDPFQKGTLTNIADGRNYFGGKNYPNNGAYVGTQYKPLLHVDHHSFTILPVDASNFHMIVTNDGGFAISKDNADTFSQLANNYITTQFYGLSRHPEKNEYIGGTQDNGTWQSPADEDAHADSRYYYRITGDGFECLWHQTNPDKLIGSVYNNRFYISSNGGENFYSSATGIASDDGPFVSKLSASKLNPDMIFAVGKDGVYKSNNFGGNWTLKEISTNWNNRTDDYVYNTFNVEPSLANENIIWAGGAMAIDNNMQIQVSTDQGETFTAVDDFADVNMNALISGIATHPQEDSTAYVLFSISGAPKVLRTVDLGQTWEDISGFGTNDVSSNGFPNVETHCLLVMPYNTDILWVGTDIGIFESTDNGTTWALANNPLQGMSISDMQVYKDQIAISTYGRGIWTVDIQELNYVPELVGEYSGEQTISAIYDIPSNVDSIELYVNNTYENIIRNVQSGSDTIKASVSDEGDYVIQLISYVDGIGYYSNNSNINVDFSPVITDLSEGSEGNFIDITANINENYDSIQIELNDVRIKSVTNSELGENIFNIAYTVTGSQVISLIGYISETGYESEADDIYLSYTGISDIFEITSLKVYPNPTSGLVTIELPDDFNDNYNVNVYSLSGAQMYSTWINKSENRINLDNLKEGLYIIRLENNGKIYSQKVQLRK
ncbi:T9SS type A sorting domain-containing protein, partial [Bacteroidota bacterium]